MNGADSESLAELIFGRDLETCQFKLDLDEDYCCPEPMLEGELLCVFHSTKLTKDQKKALTRADLKRERDLELLFLKKLGEHIQLSEAAPEIERIDLRGFRFPKTKFPKLFSKPLDLSGAIFSGETNFQGTEFKEDACFQLATFLGDASFEAAKFRKNAVFYIACFGNEANPMAVSFLNAVFDGNANFNAAIFTHYAQFSGTTFGVGGSAMFQNTIFHDVAAFSDAIFLDQTIFKANFKREAFFCRAVFEGQIKFSESVFTGEADFHKAKLGYSNFSKCVFKDQCWFMEVEFLSSSDFTGCAFMGSADFGGSDFKHQANFSLAKFEKQATYFQALFRSKTLFRACQFNGEANFYWAVFNDDADLAGTTFLLMSDFSNSVFDKTADFSYTNFGLEGRFVNTDGKAGFSGEADFRDVNRGSKVKLVFKSVNLGKARFLNTDLGDATFSNISWLRQRHRFAPWTTRPASLWDEFRSSRELRIEDYEAIAENYRQLVLNYEGKRDYETAESFHIGEMEIRRKKKAADINWFPLRKVREWLNSYGVYRASNHYGTSYGQALLTLLGLMLLFSAAFLYSGFRTADTPKQTIEYNVVPDSFHQVVGLKQWLNDFTAAFALCMSILTFQKDLFYEPLEGLARLWLFLAMILLTAQAAMILLAIRRRFKR